MGQRKERRRSRTINPNAAFRVRPTEPAESGFSIRKFGWISDFAGLPAIRNGKSHSRAIGWGKTDLAEHLICLSQPEINNDRLEFLAVQ